MKKKVFPALLILLLVCAAASFLYLNDGYSADSDAIEAFAPAFDGVDIQRAEGMIAYVPDEARAGLIFYPGGKVDHRAYAALMQLCAEDGILCVLLEMPFDLAVLDVDAAKGIIQNFPETESWYMAGHSLGGSMAASYIEKNAGDFEGLILLGSYSTADLSSAGLRVLSIYGSEDGVLNRVKYSENLKNLPADFTELVIEGGNHAGFGMYGPQQGDGTASISNEEQISICAEAVSSFIK